MTSRIVYSRLFHSASAFCKRYNARPQFTREKQAGEAMQRSHEAAQEEAVALANSPGFALRQENREKKVRKFKTIERKFFKPLPTLNLLTWKAHEQIRHLHKEHSEEWDKEMLLATFPVNPDTLNKIIMSTKVMESDAAIRRHDNVVRKRWTSILQLRRPQSKYSVGNEELSPLERSLESLVECRAISRMPNADGCKDAPFPEKVVGEDLAKPSHVGKYSLLFANHRILHGLPSDPQLQPPPHLPQLVAGQKPKSAPSGPSQCYQWNHSSYGDANGSSSTETEEQVENQVDREGRDKTQNGDETLLKRIRDTFGEGNPERTSRGDSFTNMTSVSRNLSSIRTPVNGASATAPDGYIPVPNDLNKEHKAIKRGRHYYGLDGEYLYSEV